MISRLTKSFGNAFRGFFYALLRGRNFQIQLAIAIVVIVLMVYFDINYLEKIVLLLLIALVLSLELVNTGSEKILNILEPRIHPQVMLIKDLAAASVLVASIFSLVIGIIIFWQYI